MTRQVGISTDNLNDLIDDAINGDEWAIALLNSAGPFFVIVD